MDRLRPRIFFSYNSQDRTPVEALARKLQADNFDVWLDVWNLKAGDIWQTGLQEGLRQCDCCAILFGASGTGPWQDKEIRRAIDRAATARDGSFRVVPVMLPGGSRQTPQDLPDFLQDTVWVKFGADLEEGDAYHRLTSGLLGKAPGPGPGHEPFEGQCPYRGLEAFDVKDAPFFFGRDELVQQLLARIRSMLNGAGHKLLVLVGNSGTGKSSVARAGLIGAIKGGRLSVENSAEWPVAIFRPGANPLENAALELAGLRGAPADARGLRDALGSGNEELNFFCKQLLRNYAAGSRLVMLVDQFEECFTSCEDAEIRKKFFGNLVHASQASDGQVLTILTLRADFYHECLGNAELGSVVSESLFPIPPVNERDLRDAIERPAQLAGLTFEPGLVNLLLSDLRGQTACLPLLQFTLSELWQRSKPRMTLEAYNAAGRVGGALAAKAEEVFNTLSEIEKEICHHMFLRLVQRTDTARFTAPRVRSTELITSRAGLPQVRLLLQKLAGEGRRLLTVEAEVTLSATAQQGGEEQDFVRLAHEVLIQNWPRFQKWLCEDSEFQLWQKRLCAGLEQWRIAQRKSEALLRGKLLDEATGWQSRNGSDLNRDENAFIGQSRAYRKRERAVKIAVASAFVFLCGMFVYVRYRAVKEESRQAQELYAGALASMARSFDQRETTKPLLIALYALQTVENRETLETVQDAVQRAGGPIAERAAGLTAISATRDGRKLAVAWDDGAIELWEPNTSAPNAADPAHVYSKIVEGGVKASGSVSALAISSGGDLLAAAGNRPTIELWKLGSLNLTLVEAPGGAIKSVDFSPSAKELLIASWDNPVAIRNVDPPHAGTAIPNTEHAWQAVFSPVGRQAGIALGSGMAETADLESGAERRVAMRVAQQPPPAVKSIDFSADGKRLAIGDSSGSAKLVDLDSGKDLIQLAEDSGIDRILFSPDRKFVVTMNSRGSAKVWDATSGELRMQLRAREPFQCAAFARFGDAPHIAFGTEGGKLLIYDLDVQHLRKRAHEVWVANGKPSLGPGDCRKYLQRQTCPPLEWK